MPGIAVLLKFFCVLVVLSTFSYEVTAASCRITKGRPGVINYPVRNMIVSGRDVPVNTVVYQVEVANDSIDYQCSVIAPYGLKPNVKFGGKAVAGSAIFPIGNTGLGFSVRQDYSGGSNEFYTYGSTSKYPPSPPFLGYIAPVGHLTLSVIKISDFSEGRPVIPAGSLGQVMAGDLVLFDLNLLGDAQMVFGSCETPNSIVRMGDDYELNQFESGGELPSIDFSIRLLRCPEGLKSVSYRIEKAPGISLAGGVSGVIGLNRGSSAKGVGLKITDEAGQAITLGKDYKVSSYQSSGGDFEIPLKASYVRLPGEKLAAGNADTEAIFIMSYL